MKPPAQIKYDIIDSPVGELTLSSNGTHLTSLHIEGDRYFPGIPAGWVRDLADPILTRTKSELTEYFVGHRHKFDLPLAPHGTAFQQQVWAAIAQIPASTTATYAEIAERIGKPGAARAVGTAIGRNPICIIVPCHRVVTSSGALGGYVAGLACKQQLLAIERQAAVPQASLFKL